MQQVSKQLINGLPRRIALMLLDCGLIVLCYWLAVMLRFDSGDAYRRVEILRAMAPMLLYVLPIYMIVFWFGGLYEIMWEYAGMRDLARLTCLSGLATGIIMLFDLIYHSRPISGAVLIFGAVFNTAAIAGVRFLWRLVLTMRNAKANKPEDNTPLLIVGAGNAGAWAVNLCKTKNQSFGNPVCIVDDDLTKKGLRVQGELMKVGEAGRSAGAGVRDGMTTAGSAVQKVLTDAERLANRLQSLKGAGLGDTFGNQSTGNGTLEDLRRAGIEPWAWVVNNSVAAANPRAPLLRQRAHNELREIDAVASLHAKRFAVVPLLKDEPVGVERLRDLAEPIAEGV
mgnify:CR=1 FL=1